MKKEPAYFIKDGKKIYRTRCEVYSRIVGYMRPVNQWNPGKQAEYEMRKEFKIDGMK